MREVKTRAPGAARDLYTSAPFRGRRRFVEESCDPFPTRRPDVVASIKALLLATQPEGYAGACEAIAAMDLRDDVPRIAAPTLLIAGAEDPATPPELSHEIARRITSAKVVVIPGASHLATVEQPEAITN